MKEKNPVIPNVNVKNRGKQPGGGGSLKSRRVKIKGCALIGWTYNLTSKLMYFFGDISVIINDYLRPEDVNRVCPSQNKDMWSN